MKPTRAHFVRVAFVMLFGSCATCTLGGMNIDVHRYGLGSALCTVALMLFIFACIGIAHEPEDE